jgi:hypothetical protein
MHILFQDEDVNILSKSFDLDESLRQQIVLIKDDYSIGPIQNIYSSEGIEERKQWWQNVLAGNINQQAAKQEEDDNATVNRIVETLKNDESEPVWIWIAPNKQDVSGYYWLMSQLKDFVGRVYIISLNNLPFINDKGAIFYPKNLFEIPPREFLKAKKLSRAITTSEFEIDPDEWSRICNENKKVRILDGAKKLVGKDEDFYDNFLLENITNDWQKANKVISQFFNKSSQTNSDAYSLWRLKEMISSGTIEAQGEIKTAKDFEVKKVSV